MLEILIAKAIGTIFSEIQCSFRNSYREAYLKKNVPKNFCKIYGKTSVPETQRRLQRCYVPGYIAKLLRTPFTEHIQRLILPFTESFCLEPLTVI